MSDKQLRAIFFGAAGFLLGNIIMWGAYAAYLLLTGRA